MLDDTLAMSEVIITACPHKSILLFGVVLVVLEVAVDAAVVSLFGSVILEDLIAVMEGESIHERYLIYSL